MLWEQKECAIVSCLLSSLSDSVMQDAIGKEYSRDLWDSLKHTYAKASSARVINLRDQL